MSATDAATTTPHRGDPARSRVGLAVLLILAWSSLFALIVHAVERIARGELVAARDAHPVYVRHRVALTTVERAAGARL